jgi:hypothetical protein
MRKLTVISLGWGVQSWTLAAMSALGELPPVDFAIHSDTTWEREETYKFAEWGTKWLEDHDVAVITVSDEVTASKLTDDSGQTYIPVFTLSESDNSRGQLRRSCTHRWKIVPQRRKLRELGATEVEQWLGISWDELERVKDSDVKWVTHRFPLLEKKMTRQDCINWLQAHSLPVPPKSSCVFCPYHTRQTFADIKRVNSSDWQIAVKIDEAIRDKRPGFVAYVHPDRIPLTEVKIAEDFGATQLSFVDTADAECDSGYCFL